MGLKNLYLCVCDNNLKQCNYMKIKNLMGGGVETK